MKNDGLNMVLRLPAGFAARSPEDADRRAIRALVAACGAAEYGTPDEAMIEGVEMTWEKPGFTRAIDAWAVVAPDGRLTAYGHVSPADRAHRYAHAFVHPDAVGRGIGSWLLKRIESRAQARPAGSPPELAAGETATLEQWVAATNHAARDLLSGAGYAEARHMWGMAIALDDTLEPPMWPPGITVRACRDEADLRSAHAASEEAFRDHWHYEPSSFEQFTAGKTAAEYYDPSLWFLALNGDAVLGTAICEAYPAAGRGWINTLGVRPAWRRRGIATSLLRHAFAEFRRRGLREAALGVDAQNPTGATRVYERAGMRVERQYDVFEKGL